MNGNLTFHLITDVLAASLSHRWYCPAIYSSLLGAAPAAPQTSNRVVCPHRLCGLVDEMSPKLFNFILLFFLLLLGASVSETNTLNSTNVLKDGDVIISNGSSTFAFGFFSPKNSTNRRYLGIWYNNIPVQTVVWVANRDQPVQNSHGILSISKDGNLILSSGNSTLWSTKTRFPSQKNPTAKLLDSGNLVLLATESQQVVWQSFDYPTHVFLPGMKLGLNRKSGLNWSLSSWISNDDPGTGNYSYQLEPDGFPEFFLYGVNREPVWRTGPWVGNRWNGVPEMNRSHMFNNIFVVQNDEIYQTYKIHDAGILAHLLLDGVSGTIQLMMWHDSSGLWEKSASVPTQDCDEYAKCGPNGLCNINSNQFECSCFPGYNPKSPRDWYLGDGSRGCTGTENRSMLCHNGEGFLSLTSVKVPTASSGRGLVNLSLSTIADCEKECLNNCSCVAYTSADSGYGSGGCILYYGDLIDTREYRDGGGLDLYYRVDAVQLANVLKNHHHSHKKLLVILPLCALFLPAFLSALCWFLMKKKRELKEKKERSMWLKDTDTNEDDNNINSDIPIFSLSVITTATQNFSASNKLGESGFGEVYKGVLSNGQEIAIKRLAKSSGQGIEEFKNEVRLIAKLQHRNLVKTLGCCIRGEEKMLIYEYLTNKSLDKYIFSNKEKRMVLNWRKRYDIILGIARGVLYLHQDSRLRIIHRDLKASNVILDGAMNPKISDFGMARMFGTDQIEANTIRVVGTYGYMSPEYAMHGLISVKSDVFSFGVLSLEIICGKKNTAFYENQFDNLISLVWQLWEDRRVMEIVDPCIAAGFKGSFDECTNEGCDNENKDEILKCIQIGLLCVQDNANERPNMLEVMFMLSNDDAKLRSPMEPAFVVRSRVSQYRTTRSTNLSLSTSSETRCSLNEMTSTIVEAR